MLYVYLYSYGTGNKGSDTSTSRDREHNIFGSLESFALFVMENEKPVSPSCASRDFYVYMNKKHIRDRKSR